MNQEEQLPVYLHSSPKERTEAVKQEPLPILKYASEIKEAVKRMM